MLGSTQVLAHHVGIASQHLTKLNLTYGNLMVDLRASNSKLKARSIRIVSEVTGITPADAAHVLGICNGEVKTAIVATLKQLDASAARHLLDTAGGQLRTALQS